ncbi:MAG TPA: hypothetical protein VKA70_12660 [Blastocatellia bacterium]|nr:hypothetical protein [Blastocatellia bacterium]
MHKPIRSITSLLASLALVATLFTSLSYARAAADDKFPTGKFIVGPFTVSFESDGKMNVSREGEIVVEGVYTVENDRVTITDKRGPMACLDQGPGKFQWKFDGKALTFKLIEDVCEGRAGALTSQPLNKKE